MAYLFPEEDRDLYESVKEFCEKEVKEQCKEFDKTGEWPSKIYDMAMDMGLHMMEVPEAYGGLELNRTTNLALVELMAAADAGFATSFNASSLALNAILISGSEELKHRACKILEEKKFGAFALTESDAGSDAGAGKTVAVRDGDSYVLNGRKCFITNGGVAGFYVVTAMTKKGVGVSGMSAFFVEAGTPGLSTGAEENKLGIRTSNTCDVVLDNCRIPAENLIGKEGEGFKIAMKTLDHGRVLCACAAAGNIQRSIDESVAYAKERIAFGKPLIKNQALSFKIADMAIKAETSRQMAAHCAALMDRGMPYSKEAAMAKAFAADGAMFAASEAIQIFGGYGYIHEYPVEKLLRDAKIFQIYEGTCEICRMVVAGAVIGR